MRARPSVDSEGPSGSAERLERAATLLLAASALAGVALLGWGGLIADLRPLALIGGLLWRAFAGGEPIWPALGETAARIDWEDLAPLVGTVISILFWWHAVSLVAELILLVAASVGWLWDQSLRPLWLLLDVLNSAPFAAPKRLVLATALAGQVLVRSAGPTLAAPLPSQRAIPVLLAYLDQAQPGAAAPEKEEVPSAQVAAPAGLTHRVRPGDTLSGIAARYYGHAGYWPVLFKANQGAVMAEPALGLGRPVRLTSPDYLLPGWDVVVPPLAGRLEQGAGGELVYVVQSGDTLSGIARRFGVDLADLVAANAGAQTLDGRVFEDPDLIWPQLRLRVRPLEPAPPAEAPPASEPAAPVATEPAAPMVATPSPTVEPSPLPTATPAPSNGHAVPSGGDEEAPAPTASAPAAETPARPGASEPPFGEWPLLVAAGGLSAAALLALRGRRTRRPPAEPESDTQLDVHAFTLAEPARVVAARREGGEDPHGIVLGEQVAGALLGHVRAAGLGDVRVVSVRVGRTGCVVAFEAPLDQRPRLEATLRTALHLARRLAVSRSADQDVMVQLEGIHRPALQRVRLEDCPLLLCVGLQPDTHAYLVGWEALGHVLVATQPGTTDAQEHLAGLVATLAGQCAPTELQLYTLAPPDSLPGQLCQLPHQRAAADPGDRLAAARLLANLRTEVERRQGQALEPSVPELVLVVSELAQVAAEEDLAHVLAHGRECRARVVAATADTALEREPLVDSFDSRVVFALDDEEASARLLGKPWALTLAQPGRLLVRLGLRKEVEILGLHLTQDGLRDLLASTGIGEAAPSTGSVPGEQEAPADAAEALSAESHGGPAQPAPDGSSPDPDGPAQAAVDEEAEAAPEESSVELPQTAGQPPVAPSPGVNGRAVDAPSRVSQQQPTNLPPRIATLLERARLVIDCENAAVWSAEGQLRLEQSSPIEVLFRLAAAPLLVQGPLARWPGVRSEELLEEVWAPRARDPRSRDSAQTWLAKNLARLQEDVSRAAGGLEDELLVRGPGTVRVNQNVAVSDVEAFMAVVERARAARGEELIAATKEALALRVPDLLPGAHIERSVVGRKIELYRWLGEPQWERAARRLEALGREVIGLLARAYRDAGRHEEALALYAQLLGEDPLDRRAREGLLIAAAGTGDVAQVQEAWQQICVCLGGEADRDIRALYESLLQEMQHQSAAGGMNPVAAGGGSRSGRFEDDRRGD